eukprot:m.174558 g.174558  ORF g.174558 m.174558 type:complete len:764 (-) comp15322_c1_seq6:181-2472(-)
MFPRYSLKCFCSHRTKLLMLREAKRVDSPDGNKQNKPPPGVWVHFSRPLSSTMRFFSLFALALVACAALASTTTDVDDMDLSMDIFDGPAPAELGAAPSIYRLKGVVNWLVSAFLKTRSTLYKMRSNLNSTRYYLRTTRERLAAETSRAETLTRLMANKVNRTAMKSVGAEQTRAMVVEHSLSVNIANVGSQQESALAAEVQRALTAEASLRIEVGIEYYRATTAESALSAALLVEASRTTAAEEGLVNRIVTTEDTLATQILQTSTQCTAAAASLATNMNDATVFEERLTTVLTSSVGITIIKNILATLLSVDGPENALAQQLANKVDKSSLGAINTQVTEVVTELVNSGEPNALKNALNQKVDVNDLSVIDPRCRSVVNAMAIAEATDNNLATKLATKLDANTAAPLIEETVSHLVTSPDANTLNTEFDYKVDKRNLSLIAPEITRVVVDMSAQRCREAPPAFANAETSGCINTWSGSHCNPCIQGYAPSNGKGLLCQNGQWVQPAPSCCPDPTLTTNHGWATFTSSGTWTLPSGYTAACPANVKIVAIGGGGGGGWEWGNGGYSGALAQFSGKLNSTSYTVTIGAGGAGIVNNFVGNNGAATSFGDLLTAAGGTAGRTAYGGNDPSVYSGWSAGGRSCQYNASSGGSGGSDSGPECGADRSLPGSRVSLSLSFVFKTVTAGAGGRGGRSLDDGDGGGGGGGLVIGGVGPVAAHGGKQTSCGENSSTGGAGGVGYGAGGGGGSGCSGAGAAGNSGAVHIEW